jgi:propanediol dehydratase small subunit
LSAPNARQLRVRAIIPAPAADLTPIGVGIVRELARLQGADAAAEALARAASAVSFERGAELVLGAPDDVRAVLCEMR